MTKDLDADLERARLLLFLVELEAVRADLYFDAVLDLIPLFKARRTGPSERARWFDRIAWQYGYADRVDAHRRVSLWLEIPP